jgi:HAD superfamily hydrolase (TIGR01509 family)
MIRAVIFDVDGVLIDSFEANSKFFENLMIAAGYPPPTREEYSSFFHLTMVDAIKKMIGPQPDEEVMRIFHLGESREVDYPVDKVRTSDGVEETVRALSGEYLLAIVTSRVRGSVYEVPALAKLKEYFRVAVAYEDTEDHKPSPEPLLYAARKLGIAPGECVYVGDVENDIKAARAAGMKSLLFSKESVPGADATTLDFRAIPGLIKSI